MKFLRNTPKSCSSDDFLTQKVPFRTRACAATECIGPIPAFAKVLKYQNSQILICRLNNFSGNNYNLSPKHSERKGPLTWKTNAQHIF
jgi:hypothetical protein